MLFDILTGRFSISVCGLERTCFLFSTAISLLRGYGFVQFGEESIAREAVKQENGSILSGNCLGMFFLILIYWDNLITFALSRLDILLRGVL